MIARYPGRCALTGAAIRPGDTVVWHAATRTVSLLPPVPAAVPIEPPTRAQVSRHARNRAHAAHLDHEAE